MLTCYMPNTEVDNTHPVVLAVEDNNLLMILLQEALSSEQYRARVVPTARDAMDIINAGDRVDLLLTDYMLPDIDGVELTQAVRKKLPDLKVILLSGLNPEYVEIPSELADVSFIQKPYDPIELRARVESILLG